MTNSRFAGNPPTLRAGGLPALCSFLVGMRNGIVSFQKIRRSGLEVDCCQGSFDVFNSLCDGVRLSNAMRGNDGKKEMIFD